jgi:uncharacterized coiled-coil protein SlyX
MRLADKGGSADDFARLVGQEDAAPGSALGTNGEHPATQVAEIAALAAKVRSLQVALDEGLERERQLKERIERLESRNASSDDVITSYRAQVHERDCRVKSLEDQVSAHKRCLIALLTQEM